MMKKISTCLALLFLLAQANAQQAKLPYPIIFVHGINSNQEIWGSIGANLGGGNKTFHVCLSHDDYDSKASFDADIKYIGWTGDTYGNRIYAVNFDNTKFPESGHETHNLSNQSAIMKQGKALGEVIRQVLELEQTDKVILVGHSMGGLAIREYLQRTTQSGAHRWWVGTDADTGHHVIKVVTIGTPHRGFASWADAIETLVVGVDPLSEAMRDMFMLPTGSYYGSYLFGGNENNGILSYSFYNYDINCNSILNEMVSGLNASSDGTVDNPSMKLPTNILYTWITSDWLNTVVAGTTDGAVQFARQKLFIGETPAPLGIADTLITHVIHSALIGTNDEPHDVKSLMRGLDEPDKQDFAYNILLNQPTKGYITYGPSWNPIDLDYFKVTSPGIGRMTVTLDLNNAPVNEIVVTDGTKQLGTIVSSFPTKVELDTTSNTTYYIRIRGTATSLSYQNPYILTIGYAGLLAGSVTPTAGTITDLFNFSVKFTSVPDATPDYVKLVVDGNSYSMNQQNSNWKDGALFTYSKSFAQGQHFYHFESSVGGKALPPSSEGTFEVGLPGLSSFSLSLSDNKFTVGQTVTAQATIYPTISSYPINFSSSNNSVLEPLFSNPVRTNSSGVAQVTFRAKSLGMADVQATDANNAGNTATKNLDVVSYITVTVGTSPNARVFKVDGGTYSSTQIFQWQSGSFHTIYAVDPQDGATGTKYEWTNWSNGGGISQVVSPTSNITYTANFTTKYYLTTSAGAGGDISPISGWYVGGTTVPITGYNHNFYKFSSWSGDLSGSTNPANLLINGPKSVSASFVSDSKVLEILSSNPTSGVTITVSPADKNGKSTDVTPASFLFDAGTIVSITSPASMNGIPFEAWKFTSSGSYYSTTTTFQQAMSQDWSYTTLFNSTPASEWSTLSSGVVAIFSDLKSVTSTTFVTAGVEYNPSVGYYNISVILKSTDGGSSWNKITVPNNVVINKICFPSASIGYACGSSGKILKTNDGGSTWSQISNTNYTSDGMYFYDTQTGFLLGGSRIFKTINGGATWSYTDYSFPKGGVRAMTFMSPNVAIAVGSNGEIVKSTDGGSTWVEKQSNISTRINSVCFPSSSIGYAVAGGGKAIKTTDGGESWTIQSTSVTYQLNDAAFVDNLCGFVGGNSGYLQTNDGGQTWIKPVQVTFNTMYGVAATDATNCLMAGDVGTIIRYKGSRVTVVSPNGGETLTGGDSYNIKWNQQNVNTVSINYSTDNGSTWLPIQSGLAASLGSFIWTVPNNPSDQCRIRIVNDNNPNTNDVSDNSFVIKGKPALTLLSPIGAESWIQGQPQLIEWKSSNIDNVRIDLSTNGGVLWSLLVNSTVASAQNLSVNTPLVVSSQCKIRVSDVLNSKTTDSTVGLFSINPPIPETPQNTAPINNVKDQTISPVLTWFKCQNTVHYRVQVSESADFTILTVNDSTVSDTAKAISGLKYGTTYYWRVQALNQYASSSFSVVWNFMTTLPPPLIPLLTLPSNGALGVSINPTLSWNASSRATSYQLQVSTDSSFASTVYNQSGITGESQSVNGLSNNTVYYWRVNATNAGGTSSWSTPIWHFTITYHTLPPGELIFEENFNYTTSSALTSNGWTAHSGSGSSPIAVIADNLTYPEYPSTTAKSVSLTGGSGSREDVSRTFTAQNADSFYVSFLVNVTAASTTGDYFIHLGPSILSTTFRGKIFVKKDASEKIAFGLSKSVTEDASINWTGFSYNRSTTYLIIMRYVFKPGAADDEVKLWINPPLNGTEPCPDLQQTDTGTDPSNIGTIALRQGSNTYSVILDGIRIGTTWNYAPLPIELASFEAVYKNGTIRLEWKTKTEINNYGFEVERYSNGEWSEIGFIKGNGTTNAPKNYEFTDKSAHCGKYSYRLKQVDRNGNFEYSPSIEVIVSLTAEDYKLSQNYPNPFNPTTVINFAVHKNDHTTIKIYNVLGQEVMTLFNEIAEADVPYTLTFDASHLSSGIYFYALRTKDRNEIKKMLLMK